MSTKTNFSNFTNLYEINKTLRFQLKPFPETKKFLEENEIIKKDREIEENYNKIKIYFDTLHGEFVKETFPSTTYLNWIDDFYASYLNLQTNKKNKKLKDEFEKSAKNLRKEFVSFFEVQGNNWKEKYSFLKKWWLWVLDEKEVLDLMWEFFPEEKELFKKFDRFFTYFSNFKESRKNFYADDGRAWAIATRAIDENLITFIKNLEDFKKFQKNFPDFILTNEEKWIFELEYYNNCILQDWIDIYNKILGWYSLENGNKIPWINEKINWFKQNQTHSNSKDIKFPRFKLLYKQILSNKDKVSFIENLENETELENLIFDNKEKNLEKISKAKDIINTFIDENKNYDLSWIYLSKQAINTISNKYFWNWSFIKGQTEKIWDFISFWELKWILNSILLPQDEIFKDEFHYIILNEKTAYENFLEIFKSEFHKIFENILSTKVEAIKWNFKKNNESQVEIVKNYFDNLLSFYCMTKYFVLEKWKKKIEDIQTDNHFYNDFNQYYSDFEIWKEYNLARNFITKKQVKIDKFKLNFDNSQFLTGWDKDKEWERLWIILKKENLFYLWILKNTKIFENYRFDWWNFYEKMNYKQLNNVYRQLPRLCFPLKKKLQNLKWTEKEIYLSKYKQNFWYNDEIASIKEEFDIFQKNKEKWQKFDEEKLKKLVTYYKNWVLFLYADKYNLEEIREKDYFELAPFYDDVEKKMYSLDFSKIDENFINSKVQNWDLYLFQIYNKDFSNKSTWNENIHTKYFKLLFDERNLENLVIKLSGWAEIFFRDKTKDLKKEEIITKKNQVKLEKTWTEIIHSKRYREDKIMFHISITLNANSWDKYGFNQMINEYLNKNDDIKIIWIDRWEKHLAYYSIIDKNGNIIETESLNTITWVNYLEKLQEIEKKRADKRISWWEIENIKELKNGYISQVVNKLADLIIKYNAIIIFEDLNMWFKRWRQKIERQIYQKLELALAKKLNYFTQKNKDIWEPIWYLKALQLVPKVNDYSDIWSYKQSWIMFYVNPSYTSQTCPECWLRKNIKISDTKEKQKIFFDNIKIIYDGNIFLFDNKIKSNVLRLKYNTKTGKTDEIDVNEALKKLFEKYLNNSVWEIIKIWDENADFYKSLTYYFNLILQLRNSNSKENIDYISCPSCWFHSDNWFQGKLFNWDANWAYNIARKGKILLDRIEENWEKPNLFISDVDWDEFLGNKIID